MESLVSLSKDEEVTLSGCEHVIERGLKTFVEVGEALITIRDGRLYRATHGTFEMYCSERWGMSRFYAHRIMDAAEVSEMLPIGNSEAVTESQVRPLTPLKESPALAVAAWEDAQELAKEEGLPAPVARHVEAAAAPYRVALKDAQEQKAEADKPLNIFEGGGSSRHFTYAAPPTDEQIIAAVRTEKVAGGASELRPHVSHNSGENEWYTPAEFIAAARQVLGHIELDPASSPIANQTVQAAHYYTKEDDALTKDWIAETVWMNPPYSGDLIKGFAAKFAAHALAGDIGQGIVLVNNATETKWFSELVSACSAVLFPTSRIRFLDPQGNPGAPLQGQAILYAGKSPTTFLSAFSAFGWGAYIPSQEEE